MKSTAGRHNTMPEIQAGILPLLPLVHQMIKALKIALPKGLSEKTLTEAYSLMSTARSMAALYEENFKVVSKYVHSTSKGHEAIQIAAGLLLEPQDFAYPYYRDESMLLSIGMQPFELMLQLMAKKDDPFSGGRTYYSHPSLKRDNMPKIPHQSSATGMQGIPATGAALGIRYKENENLENQGSRPPFVLCSFGDASVTEGEVAEAFQMAALHQLPILYLVQDNEWDISASADEVRAQDAADYAKGFAGIETVRLDGTNFPTCYQSLKKVIDTIRKERRPFLVHAKVPLLNHHTSGVRMEWYRDDLEDDVQQDPYPRFRNQLLELGFGEAQLVALEEEARNRVLSDFEKARAMPDPEPTDLFAHAFAPTPIVEETGNREPEDGTREVMVDQALHAIEELMSRHPECLLYGQDVGKRLGGVFREAATLAQKFGDNRVFNTAIQEAFIVGSTAGMSAVGLKPIVEVQFADYIWPGLNQLFTEVSRSCYLSQGKWPVSMVLRVPIGAYGSGGPYHSSSVESVVANIRGIKIAYPSTGADLKGLLKSAWYDPNPVVIFEHKGLYWSKNPGTERAKTIEPDADYRIPFGKARVVQEVASETADQVPCVSVITYGMGVHWALNASTALKEQVEVVDLRTLYPLDEAAVLASVRKTSRCLVLTEEPVDNSFAQALAGRISEKCFRHLDAPVMTLGSENTPAIPLNSTLEATLLPNAEKVTVKLMELLAW
jgi:2-oxoisovalerate dehydrogenase E1 component